MTLLKGNRYNRETRTRSRSGCGTCKKRKVKCDEKWPTCGNCRRMRIPCPGNNYHSVFQHFDTKIVQQNSKPVREVSVIFEQAIENRDLLRSESLRSTSLLCRNQKKLTPPGQCETSGHVMLPEGNNSTNLSPFSTILFESIPVTSAEQHIDEMNICRETDFQSFLKNPSKVSLIADSPESMKYNLTLSSDIIEGEKEYYVNPQKKLSVVPAHFEHTYNLLLGTSQKQQIFFLYSEISSTIMSMNDGPLNENTWRTIMVPLFYEYQCIFYSIASLTFHHLANNISSRILALEAMSRASFYYLETVEYSMISSKTTESIWRLPSDVSLIVSMNLAFSESWGRGNTNTLLHLRGATCHVRRLWNDIKMLTQEFGTGGPFTRVKFGTISSDKMKIAIEESFSIYESSPELKYRIFVLPKKIQCLVNFWMYLLLVSLMTPSFNYASADFELAREILFSMTKVQEARCNLTLTRSAFEEGQERSLSEHRFNDNIYLDPLLSCSHDLFVLMSEASQLVQSIRPNRHTPGFSYSSIIEKGHQIKDRLLNWDPVVPYTMTEYIRSHKKASLTWDIPSSIVTARAFKYATLIYLQQEIIELYSFSSHGLAKKIFELLGTVPFDSNLCYAHLFPLFMSSCEAKSKAERQWCRTRWEALALKMGTGNLGEAFAIVEEVWYRSDFSESVVDNNVATNKVIENSSNGFHVERSNYKYNRGDLPESSRKVDNPHFDSTKPHWVSVMQSGHYKTVLG